MTARIPADTANSQSPTLGEGNSPKKKTIRSALIPAVQRIRSTVRKNFWKIPANFRHQKKEEVSAAAPVKEKGSASTPSTPVSEIPKPEKSHQEKKAEEKEEAEKAADTPAHQIVSEQMIKEPQEEILGIFRKHPIVPIVKALSVFFTAAIISGVISAFRLTTYAEIFFWSEIGIVILTCASLIDIWLRWQLNSSIFTKDRILGIEHHGIFNHVIEIIPLSSIKFIDLKQEGFFKTLLNYGDIHVTSFINESNRDMTLSDLGNVKKAFTLLQRKSYSVNKI